LYGAGDQNRTSLQSSDNRKKISFRWNSRTFPAGSLVVANKSAEQQMTELADSGKLVPYEDDVSDDSEVEKEAAETTESMSVTTEDKTRVQNGGCADSCDDTCSFAPTSLLNSKSDDVDINNTDTKQAECIMTSSAGYDVPGIDERLSSGDCNSGENILAELSLNLVSVAEVELAAGEKEAGPSFSEDGLPDSGVGCVNKPVVADITAFQLKNGHLSSDSNAVSHVVAGTKRHARHRSKRHHTKHRRRHAAQSSASNWYSSDEEMEYVWVEKTAETIAQQLTGK